MRPRFSFMWFWVVVAIGIIGASLIDKGEARPIEGDWDMVGGLVENGCVERIEVKDRENASVYLTKAMVDSLLKDDRFKGMPTTGAQITFNTGGDVQLARRRAGASISSTSCPGYSSLPFGSSSCVA